MNRTCRACEGTELEELVSFARQPIASRFKRAAAEQEDLCDLDVVGCRMCGLVQLASIPAVEALRPRFNWLRYNEPEAHLDEVASAVGRLARHDKPAVGLTYKDNTFLTRLGQAGFTSPNLDLASGALAAVPTPWGIETVAAWLSGGAAASVAKEAGVVVARHVLEHCEHPLQAVQTMLSWLAEDGLLLVEVPGCREALVRGIPELLWEEHASYFTAPTLQRLLQVAGAETVHFSEHQYPFESSLVAVVRPTRIADSKLPGEELSLARDFGRKVILRVAETAHGLGGRKSAGRRTVIFGAGHLSCAFLSLSQAADAIECVLDDTPQKQGLFLAGTRLPIIGTEALPTGEPGLCLLAVHPSAEAKVHDRLAPLRAAGWETASIFPDSPYAVRWN